MSELGVPESLYLFGCGVSGPRGATAEVVGNKAVSLIRMAAAGLPIPPGFVLPTTLGCAVFREAVGSRRTLVSSSARVSSRSRR